MNLYVDVGNSRVKWIYDGMTPAKVANDLESLATQWRELGDTKIEMAVGCCVRGKLTADNVNQLARQMFGINIQWQASVLQACGVKNAYVIPDHLGVDRWVALIAARARYPERACIVVDAGTAITVDMLDASGQHCGGVILPGAKIMLDTLDKAEQLFPETGRDMHEFAESVQALTKTTQDAILSGVIFAVQGGVCKVISQQVNQIGVKIGAIPIILTGGDANMLKLDSLQTLLVPDLVLEGLQVLTGNGQ